MILLWLLEIMGSARCKFLNYFPNSVLLCQKSESSWNFMFVHFAISAGISFPNRWRVFSLKLRACKGASAQLKLTWNAFSYHGNTSWNYETPCSTIANCRCYEIIANHALCPINFITVQVPLNFRSVPLLYIVGINPKVWNTNFKRVLFSQSVFC